MSVNIDEIVRMGLQQRKTQLENSLKWTDRNERNTCGLSGSERAQTARSCQERRGELNAELRQVKMLLDNKVQEEPKRKIIKTSGWYSGAG